MDAFWIIILVLFAVLGNYFIRRIIRRVNNEPEPILNTIPEESEGTPKQFSRLLDLYGRPGGVFTIPEEHLPLNQQVIDMASNYREVCFDSLIKVFDRSLMQTPFTVNPKFLQVGNWGDGSEVLMKRRSEDPRVYIASIEDGDPRNPSVLAETFSEYLSKAFKDFEEANVIMRRHTDG